MPTGSIVLQMDIIPVSLGPFCYINAEDGVVLGDARLRTQLTQGFPDLWKRVQARRAFMRDVLGINLDDSVLPRSAIPPAGSHPGHWTWTQPSSSIRQAAAARNARAKDDRLGGFGGALR